MYYIARESQDPGNFFQHAKKAQQPQPRKSFGAPPRGSFAVDGLPPELQDDPFIPPHLANKEFMQRPSIADLKALEAQGKQVRVKKIYHLQKDDTPKSIDIPINNFSPPVYHSPMQHQYADPYHSPSFQSLQQPQQIHQFMHHQTHSPLNTPPNHFPVKQKVEQQSSGSLPNQFVKANGHILNCSCHSCEPRKNCHCEYCHDQHEHSAENVSPVNAKHHVAHAPVHRAVSQSNVNVHNKAKPKQDCNCYECQGATAPFDKGQEDGWSVATDKSSKSWYKK